MIYCFALLIWIISVLALVIVLKYNFDYKLSLKVSQIYNFMTGFLGWAISFLSMMFTIKCLGNITNIYVCYILSIIPLLLLLLPLNIKIKKKAKINIIVYFILSIFITILGFGTFVFVSNII